MKVTTLPPVEKDKANLGETSVSTKKEELVHVSRSRKKHPFLKWLDYTPEQVLGIFAMLPNAKRVGTGDEQFVFVPGTREDRVLLVAHADTVWRGKDEQVDPVYHDGIFFSGKKGVGIGADDRAGCAMLWALRDTGHSLLIPNAEERGCVGSRFLMRQKEWAEEMDKHRFAIEMDRRGNNDLVYYDVGSTKFTEFTEKNCPGYTKAHGSFTDIGVLCEKICGMNISVGYYREHSPEEHIKMKEWHKTLQTVRSLISIKDLPRFEQDPPPPRPVYTPHHTGHYGMGFSAHHVPYHNGTSYPRKTDYDSYDDYIKAKDGDTCSPVNTDDLMVCPHCEMVQDVSEWKANKEQCIAPNCGKQF